MPETLADIVAEMRELADDIEAGNAVVGQTVWRNYADRIEAAAKREREKADALSAGGLVEAMRHKPSNAAAMREALCEIVLLTVKAGKSISCDVACGIIASKAKHALAAPPRNCDLPEVAEWQPTGMAKQAWRVFKRSHKDSHLDAYGLLRCINWLYSPATEKEGGKK